MGTALETLKYLLVSSPWYVKKYGPDTVTSEVNSWYEL